MNKDVDTSALGTTMSTLPSSYTSLPSENYNKKVNDDKDHHDHHPDHDHPENRTTNDDLPTAANKRLRTTTTINDDDSTIENSDRNAKNHHHQQEQEDQKQQYKIGDILMLLLNGTIYKCCIVGYDIEEKWYKIRYSNFNNNDEEEMKLIHLQQYVVTIMNLQLRFDTKKYLIFDSGFDREAIDELYNYAWNQFQKIRRIATQNGKWNENGDLTKVYREIWNTQRLSKLPTRFELNFGSCKELEGQFNFLQDPNNLPWTNLVQDVVAKKNEEFRLRYHRGGNKKTSSSDNSDSNNIVTVAKRIKQTLLIALPGDKGTQLHLDDDEEIVVFMSLIDMGKHRRYYKDQNKPNSLAKKKQGGILFGTPESQGTVINNTLREDIEFEYDEMYLRKGQGVILYQDTIHGGGRNRHPTKPRIIYVESYTTVNKQPWNSQSAESILS